MFKVNVGNNLYKVFFVHSNPVKQRKKILVFEGINTNYPGTYCFIVNETDESQPIILGKTSLHPLDWNKYNKEFGRKFSLKRALKVFDRHTRSLFWNEYFRSKTLFDSK